MATDLAKLVNEFQDRVDCLIFSNRQLAVRAHEAEEHARQADIIIQGAWAVLRDHGIVPEPHEDLAGTLARVLRERVDAKRRR